MFKQKLKNRYLKQNKQKGDFNGFFNIETKRNK